jgi:hypothetical protein
MQALYGAGRSELARSKSSELARSKRSWLARFQYDGFWLLDVADRPINRLSRQERSSVLRDTAPAAVATISATAPSVGVIACQEPTYTALEAADVKHRLFLLHDEPIRFPLGKWRRAFVQQVRTALVCGGIRCPL